MSKPSLDIGDVVQGLDLSPVKVTRVVCVRPDGLIAIETENGTNALVEWGWDWMFHIVQEWCHRARS